MCRLERSGVLPASLELRGIAADDGLPTDAGLTVKWEYLSGPGAGELLAGECRGEDSDDERCGDVHAGLDGGGRAEESGVDGEGDGRGNVATRRDFNGAVTSFSYDSLNRLLANGPVSFTYSATGQRLTMTDPSGTTSYTIGPAYTYTDPVTQGQAATLDPHDSAAAQMMKTVDLADVPIPPRNTACGRVALASNRIEP